MTGEPPNGMADPPGEHLLVLAEGTSRVRAARARRSARRSWRGEGRAAHVARDAGRCRARTCTRGTTRARTTTIGSSLPDAGRARCRPRCNATVPPPLSARCDELVDGFGRDRVLVELWDHGDPLDRHRNDALRAVRVARSVSKSIATNNVHYAHPSRRPLWRTRWPRCGPRRSLDEIDGWLPANPFAHLRSPAEQAPPVRALARRGRAHGRDRGAVRVRPEARGTEPARLAGAARSRRHVVAARARAPGCGSVLSGVASAVRRRRCARSSTSSR